MAIVTAHEPRETSAQRGIEAQSHAPDASVDPTEARNALVLVTAYLMESMEGPRNQSPN
jgi:hypothetical protein